MPAYTKETFRERDHVMRRRDGDSGGIRQNNRKRGGLCWQEYSVIQQPVPYCEFSFSLVSASPRSRAISAESSCDFLRSAPR